MKRIVLLLIGFLSIAVTGFPQQTSYNGFSTSLGDLMRMSDTQSRSISPENFTGEKGKGGMATLEEGITGHRARDLGQGWKVNPFVDIKPGETFVLGKIEGPGIVKHIWMTVTGHWRYSILRIYWDGENVPSVESPVGDFFAQGWERYVHINSLPVTVNPGSGFNSFWQMPFRKKAKFTITNKDTTTIRIFYQIDYSLTAVPDNALYFHAQFRRVNPLPYKNVYTIVDNIKGKGHYVGTYLAHGANSPGWWGEGEIKFYIDGDTKFPTINGTGEEDYFLGSYGYASTNFTTMYSGYHQIKRHESDIGQRRFGEYRWHILDPISFDKDLKVTIQSLGWQNGRYLPLQDDIASVAYWYQTEPHEPFPQFPTKEELGVSWSAPLNAFGKVSSIELKHQPDPPYGQKKDILLDGEVGYKNFDNGGKWLGFKGNNFVAIIDLNMIRAIQSVSVRFLGDQSKKIFQPVAVEILISEDGKAFKSIYRETNEILDQPTKRIRTFQVLLKHKETKFVKVIAKNIGECPGWHQKAGKPAWLLADEIIIK